MRTSIIASTAVLSMLFAAPASAEDTIAPSPSPTPTAAAGVEIPDFATKSWVVADATSGEILAGQEYDVQRPMASTLKTLTALTLLPRLQWDSTYEADARETLTEGMHVGVLAGQKYTVSELFHGMMMRSGNDAAVALADAYGYQRTIDAMNAEAQRVGATQTVAMSPNGLDWPGQVTTAADLAQIYRVAIQDPRLQEIMTAREAEFPAQLPKDPKVPATTFTIYNHDTLLNTDYPGFKGAKSGFTSQAGRTYVVGAEQNGRTLVIALLGIGGGTTQTARQVLDWAFANVDGLSAIGELPEPQATTEIAAEPANSGGEDLAPEPLDEQTLAGVEATAAMAQEVTAQAVQTTPPSMDVPLAASTSASSIGSQSMALTTSGTGAMVALSGLQAPPFAGPAEPPPAAEPAQRGFFTTLLIGMFKALLWILLFLGIAVVLLRIRAVRRRNRRRAHYERVMRERAAQSPAEAPTLHRSPSRTG
jgi:D-alanyl-D-alanine carboxypeptidase (penicillin-binding protein 5/6)